MKLTKLDKVLLTLNTIVVIGGLYIHSTMTFAYWWMWMDWLEQWSLFGNFTFIGK